MRIKSYLKKLLGCLLLLSCFFSAALAADLAATKPKPKPVVIGMMYFYPPFVYSPSIGFDINLVQRICIHQGIQCTFVAYPFDELLADLKAKHGKLDAAVGAISITHQRLKQYDFVGPYYQSTMSFLAKKGVDQHISLSQLHHKKIGVEKGSIFYFYLVEREHMDRNLKVYEQTSDQLQALRDGDVDAIVLDTPTAQYWQHKSHCKLTIVSAAVRIPADLGYGIMIRKDNVVLKKLFNQGLQAIQTNGSLKELTQSYFSDQATPCQSGVL